MNPPLDRRNFLRMSALLGGAAAANVAAAAISFDSEGHFQLNGNDRGALGFAQGFGDRCLLHGAGLAARLKCYAGSATAPLSILVKNDGKWNLTGVLSTFRRHGVERIVTSGSQLHFVFGCQEYSIEVMEPVAWEQRRAGIASGTLATFAHDALHASPEAGSVSNTFLFGGELRPLRSAAMDTPRAFQNLLRGLKEAGEVGLVRTAAFNSFAAAILSSDCGSNPTPVARQMFVSLPGLEAHVPEAEVHELVQSPLVSGALSRAWNVQMEFARSSYAAYRNRGAGVSAAWYAALAKDQIHGGVAEAWARAAHPLHKGLVEKALDGARLLAA